MAELQGYRVGAVRSWRGSVLMALLAMAAGLLAGCSSDDDGRAQMAQAADGPPRGGGAERAIPVSARIAVQEELQVTLRGSTNLRARETVEVIPKESGIVASIRVEEGDRVAEGDVLAQLDDEEWRLQAAQAQARAQATSDQVTRARALADLDLISEQEVGNLVSDSAVAASDLELAELRVRNAAIRTPISGVVTHRYIERGSQITTANPAFTVADVDRLEARVAVPERQASAIQVGQAARLMFQEGADPIATGTVERIRPVVDAESGTVQVTITVSAREDSRLRPGQFVNVDIVTETLAERITLPRTAVLVDGAVPRVFVIQDGQAVEREVSLGYARGDRVEVATGLAAGDTVVVIGQDNLRPGVPVRLMELDGQPVEGQGQ
jgi:membrane fusion protein, multidrug efflux system